MRSQGEIGQRRKIILMICADTDGIDQYNNTGKDRNHDTRARAEFTAFASDGAFNTAEIHNCCNDHQDNTEGDQYQGIKPDFGQDYR